MDEPRIDRNVELDILSFWEKEKIQFWSPELASMVCDVEHSYFYLYFKIRF